MFDNDRREMIIHRVDEPFNGDNVLSTASVDFGGDYAHVEYDITATVETSKVYSVCHLHWGYWTDESGILKQLVHLIHINIDVNSSTCDVPSARQTLFFIKPMHVTTEIHLPIL